MVRYPSVGKELMPEASSLSPFVLKSCCPGRAGRYLVSHQSFGIQAAHRRPHPARRPLMPAYSYAACLDNAYKVNWRIEDVLGDRRFDPSKRWLPLSLSGAGAATCLDEAGKRALTQVELAAYAHLFGYVEEFIAPKVGTPAHDFELAARAAFAA